MEIKVHCLFDEMIDPVKLKNHDRNRNKHPQEQIERFAKILKYQGWRHAIKVSKRSGKITTGHGRKLTAIYMGLKSVPVVFQDYESEEQEYLDVQADNAIASWAEIDLAGINADLSEMGPFDIDLLGIEDFTVDMADKELAGDVDEIPEKVEAIAQLGNIFRLGDHRLMCGSCTDPEAVNKLFNGNLADITFTSPPYNAGDNIRGSFYQNDDDDKTEQEYTNFLNEFTKLSLKHSKFVFVNVQILESNKRSLIKYQYDNIDHLKDVLIWNKKQYPPHINKGTFGCKWEYVFAFSNTGKSRAFPCSWQGKFPNVIETENNSGNEYAESHKAGFPVAFPTWMIEKMDFAKSCYDPFMGTGTTLVACEKLRLNSYGMELDPHYVDVIIARWEKLTNQKAELING